MNVSSRASHTTTKTVETLRLKLKSGDCVPGSVFPSEKELAEELDVSRGTVRKAIEQLVASGDLSRLPHSRPVVAPKDLLSSLHRAREIPIWVSRPVSDGGVLSFLRGISKGLRGTPYRMVVREPSRVTHLIVEADERQFVQDLLTDTDFAGAVFWHDEFAKNQDLFKKLADLGKPLVFVDIPPPEGIGVDYITTENNFAARSCVEHLLELGHSNIVFVADTDVPMTTRERMKGYERAMISAGHQQFCHLIVATEEKAWPAALERSAGPYQKYVRLGSYYSDLAQRAVRSILAMSPRPTAIFACCDELAVHMHALMCGMGIEIPEEISLVGFDWIADGEKGFPDFITTVAQPFEKFGMYAASLLLDRIDGAVSKGNRNIMLEAPLVVRLSTGINPQN